MGSDLGVGAGGLAKLLRRGTGPSLLVRPVGLPALRLVVRDETDRRPGTSAGLGSPTSASNWFGAQHALEVVSRAA